MITPCFVMSHDASCCVMCLLLMICSTVEATWISGTRCTDAMREWDMPAQLMQTYPHLQSHLATSLVGHKPKAAGFVQGEDAKRPASDGSQSTSPTFFTHRTNRNKLQRRTLGDQNPTMYRQNKVTRKSKIMVQDNVLNIIAFA